MNHFHPFTNRSFQLRPKMIAKKHNLLPLTRLNRAKLSKPKRVNVGPLPEATQQNWSSTLGKAKDAADVTANLAPKQGSQPMDTPCILSPTSPEVSIKFTEHPRYCVICTLLGKTCLKEFPMSSDLDDDEEEED